MATILNPYIGFQDNARDAMEFYKSVFGGSLRISTFAETYASQDPSEGNKIMHAQLDTENGMTIMAADTPNGMEYSRGTNFSISLSGENEAELKGYFQRLSTGGQVVQPLEQAPWGDTFGMVTDPFGVTWIVNINGKAS